MANLTSLIVNDTGFLKLPSGTVDQRPSATAGRLRYNTSKGELEINTGTKWKSAQIAEPSIVTNGLVLHLDAGNVSSYPGTGTTWSDLSGNNNGTLTNGPTYNSGNGGSIVFDGTNDYVNLPYLLLSGSSDFTINIWLKSNSYPGGTLFGNYPAGNLQCFYGNSFIGMWLNNSSTYLTSPSTEFTTNPVMFSALRTGGNETRCYLNSVLKKTGASAVTIGSTANFRIGTNTNSGEVYNGSIFTVSIYNRALTETEIQQNFNALRGRFGI